mgnify:CR=1 FL=1
MKPIFSIEKVRSLQGELLQIRVNFFNEIIFRLSFKPQNYQYGK